jgi:hypothetical protein
MKKYNKNFKPETSAEISTFLTNTCIGDAATQVAMNRQFPIETAHLAALCVASQAASVAYCVEANGKRMPIGLYCLGEQPPGSAKTSAVEDLQGGIMEAVSEVNKKRKEILKKIAESEQDNKGKLNPQEIEDMERNHIIKAPMTDVTAESIDKNLTQSKGWFMLASTEKALIGSLISGNYSDGKSNKDILLKGFNGEWHASDRVTRNGFYGRPHGSMLAISQEGTIDEVLKSSSGSGLCERFLMILEGNMMGFRDPYKYGGDTGKIRHFNNVTKLLFSNVTDMDIDNMKSVKISKEAHKMVIDQMADIEPRLADGEKYATTMFRGIWSKMHTQMFKIAATIHLMESKTELEEISGETMALSISVVKTILRGMIELCEVKGISGKNVELSALEDYMERNAKGISGKTLRQIKDNLGRQEVFKQHGKSKIQKIETAVSTLCSNGVIERRINGTRETYIYRG